VLGRWCSAGIVVPLSGVWASVVIASTLVLCFFFTFFLLLFLLLLSLFLLYPFFFLLFLVATFFALHPGVILLLSFLFTVAGVTVSLSP
jgi:hypothetical protein